MRSTMAYALESILCMLSQHYAIGLQTDCMVIVLGPMVEAARVPHECLITLGYGLPPCMDDVTGAFTRPKPLH